MKQDTWTTDGTWHHETVPFLLSKDFSHHLTFITSCGVM